VFMFCDSSVCFRDSRSLHDALPISDFVTTGDSKGRRRDEWVTPTSAASSGGQTSRSGDRKGELLLSGQARGLMLDDAEAVAPGRSEEHTSELQSRENLVCRLLLEKK